MHKSNLVAFSARLDSLPGARILLAANPTSQANIWPSPPILNKAVPLFGIF